MRGGPLIADHELKETVLFGEPLRAMCLKIIPSSTILQALPVTTT